MRGSSSIWMAVSALALTAVACGGSSAASGQPRDARGARRTQTRIAVLPPVWVAGGTTIELDAAAAVGRGFGRYPSVRARTASLGERDAAECAEDLSCVREVGAHERAAKAVVTRLAELGETVVVRVSMIDVEGGTQEEARQEVVRNANAARVGAALERLARELGRPFAPPEPPPDAWYERWEVWAGGGVLVAAGVTATVLVVSGGGGRGPDGTITPPRPSGGP